MKNVILLLLFVIIPNMKNYSQDLSIEFSIEWNKTIQNDWKKYKLKSTPFLNIKYINNTDKDFYFTKKPVFFDFMTNWTFCSIYPKSKFSHKKLKSYDNRKYYVDLPINYGDYLWYVYDDIYRLESEQELAFVNYDLLNVYKYLYKKYKLINYVNLIHTENSNNLNEKITGLSKDYFIFLKSGESHTYGYDLTGFNILGGTYTFGILDKNMKDYVETTSLWDESQKKWVRKKELLPSDINEYKLYQGDIKTNEVSISFDSIKLK